MNDAKRILILGASGMIGRALYQRLNRHRGWKITGHSDRSAKRPVAGQDGRNFGGNLSGCHCVGAAR